MVISQWLSLWKKICCKKSIIRFVIYQSMSSQLILFTLTVQPQISATNPEQVVHVGDNAMVPCNVLAGNPPPTVTWYHRGERLYPSIIDRLTLLPDGSLGVMGATLTDAGNYTCVAENVVGNDTRSTNLRVHGMPQCCPLGCLIMFKLTIPFKPHILCKTVTFSCYVIRVYMYTCVHVYHL